MDPSSDERSRVDLTRGTSFAKSPSANSLRDLEVAAQLNYDTLMGRTAQKIIVLVCLTLLSVPSPFVLYASQKKRQSEEQDIPKQPSLPPPMAQPTAKFLYECERLYRHQGKTLSCDSPSQADGDKLRPLFQEVPSALEELELYQWNKRTLNRTAYLSSLGVAIALIGYAVNRPAFQDGMIKPGGYLILSGLGLSAASFAYGISVNRANEGHFKKAIENYNQARPDEPIELQLSVPFNFK